MGDLTRCAWDDGWSRVACDKPAEDRGLCGKHAAERCRSCGAPATRSCPEALQWVCGSPLCGGCKHDWSDPHACRHVPKKTPAEETGR